MSPFYLCHVASCKQELCKLIELVPCLVAFVVCLYRTVAHLPRRVHLTRGSFSCFPLQLSFSSFLLRFSCHVSLCPAMLSSPVSEKVPPLVALSVCEPLQKDQQQQVVLSIAEDSLTSETDSLSYLADDSVDVVRCPVCKGNTFRNEFTRSGITLALLFFPIGLLFSILLTEKRCHSCGYQA